MSAQLTTEGVTAFVELAEQVLQVDTYSILGQADWEADKFLKVADQNPNRAGAELLAKAGAITIGADCQIAHQQRPALAVGRLGLRPAQVMMQRRA